MSIFSLGDLAQSYMLQRRGLELKNEMSRLNAELTSGQISDVKSVLAGNFSYLSDIENDLKTLTGFKVATSEAAQFADASQIALERVHDTASALGTKVLTGASIAVGPVLDQIIFDAEGDLDAILSALNTSQGGRSLFSGTATDMAAMVDTSTLLTNLRSATAGATSPGNLITMADAWFDDPAGFAATSYLGSNDSLSAFRLSSTETVGVSITANDAVLRNLLRSVAVTAIVSDAAYAFDDAEKRVALKAIGDDLFQSQAELTALRANVGSAQARIDTITVRNAAEETSLRFAKGALLNADPYETATKLEDVQFKLQSLYTVTARMSDLSLVNFIR